MAIQKYDGKLGKFEYDDKEFKYFEAEYGINLDIDAERLEYIGSETDGSKIKIPEGIVDVNYMFEGCESLEKSPVIPDSVKYCDNMFVGCTSLKEAPVIPNGVTSCDSMFERCESLEKPPVIPDGVEYCRHMFEGCVYSVQDQGEWNMTHRGQSYNDYHKSIEIQSETQQPVYINSINEKCIKQIFKDDKICYAVGVKVDKSMSESGYVNITCNEENLHKSKSGKSYIVMFNNDHERKSQIVKNGKKETVKLSVSDIAKSHESTFGNRKTISTPNAELSDDKQFE